VPGELGPHYQGQLRPPDLGRTVLVALHRRRPQCFGLRLRGGGQNIHGHGVGPRRCPPALRRNVQPHRRVVETAAGLTPGQQPRRRDPKARPRRPIGLGRFCPPTHGRFGHRRHLRAHRGAPQSLFHGGHVQPRAHQSAQVRSNVCKVAPEVHRSAIWSVQGAQRRRGRRGSRRDRRVSCRALRQRPSRPGR
jgi:hypothetical protein